VVQGLVQDFANVIDTKAVVSDGVDNIVASVRAARRLVGTSEDSALSEEPIADKSQDDGGDFS